jgi:hypothetical protein
LRYFQAIKYTRIHKKTCRWIFCVYNYTQHHSRRRSWKTQEQLFGCWKRMVGN